jgi:predicted RNase H-like HicB family nuclease
MKTRNLSPARKRKKRLRRNKLLSPPTMPQALTSDSVEILSSAYPIAIYWDNDENCFICELSAFNSARLHAATWDDAAIAAKTAHTLLINVYRANGYTLPEVG